MRPQQIKDRVENVAQIEGIISAMRALALGHQREARRHLEAIQRHADTVARALGEAVEAGRPPYAARRPLLIVVGAGQGFTGAYGDRLALAAQQAQAAAPGGLLVVGARTREALAALGLRPDWAAEMPDRAEDIPPLASRLADAALQRIGRGQADAVVVLHAAPDHPGPPEVQLLLPLPQGGAAPGARTAPLMRVARDVLVAQLLEEHVFAGLCAALMLGFAAESEARATAMARAQSNVREIRADLTRTYQTARQDEMTAEIAEVSAMMR